MGSTGNSLFSVKIANDGAEDVNISSIKFTDLVGGPTSFNSSLSYLYLYNGSTEVGSSVLGMATSTQGYASFTGLNIPVAKDSSITLELKGDVSAYGNAVSGSTHQFEIASANDITATGKDSTNPATIYDNSHSAYTDIAVGNTATVYRTKISLASAADGSTTGRTRVANDDLADLTFTADPAGDLTVKTITLTLSGKAITGIEGNSTTTIDLIDPSTSAEFGGATQQIINSGTTSVTFSGINYPVSAGSSKTVKVRVNSTNFGNSEDSLSVYINAATDFTWNDNGQGTGSDANLESTVVPFTVANVSYN